MIELPLDVDARHPCSSRVAFFRKYAPFVENSRAVLIHRPRTVNVYKLGNREPHFGFGYWCNNGSTGKRKFTPLFSVPECRIVCARCEDAATAAGLPSSSAITGRHVCIGGVKAVSFCCPHKNKIEGEL